MKKALLLLFFALSSGANAQAPWNLTLLSHFNDTGLAKFGNQIWNECTGYADTVNHKEYAIAGSVDSIYFFDITNPTIMKKVDVESGISHSVNRDFDIYDHYIYCVSDNSDPSKPPGALQIFDLKYLPDSVHKVYESDATGYKCHTVFVNPKSKRLYKVSNWYKQISIITPVEIYSLEDPENPAFLGRLVPPENTHPYVHETYVRNDTVYCSTGNPGFYIYSMVDPLRIKLLGSITPPYPENAYNHSSCLDSSGRYVLFTDETPDGKGMKIYDLADIGNPILVGSPFRSTGSPHNSYWVGRFAYTSMYFGGVHIYDLQNKTAPRLVATYPTFNQAHTAGSFEGCWGVYPFLPSGNLIASDMNTGIFLLKPSANLATTQPQEEKALITVYPNPFSGKFTIELPTTQQEQVHLFIYDLQGKIADERSGYIRAGVYTFETSDPTGMKPGGYLLKVVTGRQVYHRYVFKQ